jgi:hypothetical protein
MRKLLLVVLVLFALTANAQKKAIQTPPTQKQPLTHAVYDGWKEIPFKSLTPDGNFAVLTVNPQEGDGKTIFYNLKTGAQDSLKRADNASVTFDSRFAVVKIKPSLKIVRELRRQKKKKEDLPKDSLGIYSFALRTTSKVSDVRSYKIPEKTGGWLAYQVEPKKEPKGKADDKKFKKKRLNSDDNGLTLVLRNLNNGKEILFGFVKEYQFAKRGQGLLFSSSGNDSTLKAGVYWYALETHQLVTLFEGKASINIRD